MYCFVVIDCYLPSAARARMSLSSPKSLMLSWSVSSRKKYPCLTARWTSKQRPRHASSTRSDRMSWARPWQGRKQADTVMQQPSHLMCICKASGGKKHCSFALLYLQLAAVQAGHWNLLHFHLPALPDEQSLLWSCCRERGIGQNRAAAEGGGIQSTTLASHTNWGNQL